ncbi:GspH/FimT family pseudopilin [Rhodopila sp.]|uniref:GspH/FimT family pseudopilin n=1 Tax=Rhodopila sp. TaxID=2480087 RepID=UPI003D12C45E
MQQDDHGLVVRVRGGRTSQTGFTLLEMIVVIIILGLVAGLVLVRQPWHSAGLNADATVRALTSALRLARSRAIAQDRDVSVATNSQFFTLDSGPPWVLPSGEALSASQVIFMPDGGSSGTTIVLAAGPRRIAIAVNWLNGRVLTRELDIK